MLISYALDAGATNDGHGMDALSERWLGHQTDRISPRSPARARTSSASPALPIDKATEYAAEDADVTLRLWRALEAAPARRRHDDGL